MSKIIPDQLEKVAREIAAQFQLEGDWPWEYIYGELKKVHALGYDEGFTKGNYNVPHGR